MKDTESQDGSKSRNGQNQPEVDVSPTSTIADTAPSPNHAAPDPKPSTAPTTQSEQSRMSTNHITTPPDENGPSSTTELTPNRSENGDPNARPPSIQGSRAPTSLRPYSAFPQSTKWLIVALGGAAGIFSPISSNIFVPAIPTLAQEFKRSEQDISLAVTVYLIFQATTPSLFGSLSDSYGRRPIYIGTLALYIGANIGLALMPTSAYWLLLFLRALQVSRRGIQCVGHTCG